MSDESEQSDFTAQHSADEDDSDDEMSGTRKPTWVA